MRGIDPYRFFCCVQVGPKGFFRRVCTTTGAKECGTDGCVMAVAGIAFMVLSHPLGCGRRYKNRASTGSITKAQREKRLRRLAGIKSSSIGFECTADSPFDIGNCNVFDVIELLRCIPFRGRCYTTADWAIDSCVGNVIFPIGEENLKQCMTLFVGALPIEIAIVVDRHPDGNFHATFQPE